MNCFTLFPLLLLVSLLVCTSSSSESSLRFLCVGDWGGQDETPYTTPIQLQVARQMGKTAASFQSDFTIAIGDNFYSRGVTDVEDPRFKATFESVYTEQALQTPWYVVAGNHDHNGNVTAQIDYTKRSHRWHYPAEWYSKIFHIPNSVVTVEFVFIDTVVYAGPWPQGAKQPIGSLEPSKAQEEYEWIKKTLASSTADWLFVVGHYPVWSIAEHGPTENLVKSLKPLLEEHGVAGYINGHDHTLQHLNDGSKVDYYVIGAGHSSTNSTEHKHNVPSGSLKFFWPPINSNQHGGFATVEVSERSMKLTIIEDTGRILYTTEKGNPRRK